jgi:hypothetical protein
MLTVTESRGASKGPSFGTAIAAGELASLFSKIKLIKLTYHCDLEQNDSNSENSK